MYGYRLIAKKAGKRVVLAEYRGDDTGLYDFNVERFKLIDGECGGGNTKVPCGGKPCTGDNDGERE